MTRRRAAWLAAVVAVLLGATYLLTRRTRPVELPVPPARPEPAPPATVVAAPQPRTDPEPALVEEPALTAPIVVDRAAPQSWDGGRAVPARTPLPARHAVGEARDVEEPLPTWVRLAIVAGALLAFFAVSLIATKHV